MPFVPAPVPSLTKPLPILALVALCGLAGLSAQPASARPVSAHPVLAKTASAASEPEEIVALEPAQAGPDFAVQGEFAGRARLPGGIETGLGVQVVAAGDGAYRVVFFPGGLPGDGWSGEGRVESEGVTVAGSVSYTGEAYEGTLAGDSLRGTGPVGETFALGRKSRVSPTVGLAPPAQATVLFDGTSLEAWDSASVDERGFFQPKDPVSMTRKRFADFSFHMEFRIPFMPSAFGQGRGNSGLKFLTRDFFFAEIQILDSFGNEARQDECGGIEVLFKPEVIASFPPLAWQTFDIHVTTPVTADTAAFGKGSMTVWQNGILIHPPRMLPTMASAVNLALQKFQGPVFFRNMWVVEGDDRYPFFPGAAIRSGDGAASGPGRGKGLGQARVRVVTDGKGGGRGPSVEVIGPDGLYLPDGRGLPPESRPERARQP